ncbi:MAG: hypothetical protein NT001_07740 [Candidatus Woesearchaeota archaeon]|nr:hypothetical protein [Candidatus Woesearchaeota archaeon]
MAKKKKQLTQQQEFEIMKLVLDKFLWLGFIVMAWGMYTFFVNGFDQLATSVSLLVAGAIVLLIFMSLIVKEYEIVR